jgi:predicted transcriptional regulator
MEVAQVLSSTAKFEVLNILFKDPSPLRVRNLEQRTGLAVRSVQVALNNLVNENVVIRKNQNNKPVYYLNKSHKSYSLINNIFKAIELDRIARRSDSYNAKAKKTFQFISEASELFKKARS